MGLKAILQEKTPGEQQSKAEDLQLLKELTEKLDEAQQKIQTLQSQNSTLQSENQKLLFSLTTANAQIESLTSRAASVNETELKNKKLLNAAKEAEVSSVKALEEAKHERQRAERAREDAEKAAAKQKQEEQQRREAEREASTAKKDEERTKSHYKALFMGEGIFTITVAVLTAYSRRMVFVECGKWVVDRRDSLISFFQWIISSFMGLAGFFSGQFQSLDIAWCYVIAGIIFAAVTAGLFFAGKKFVKVMKKKISTIKREYKNGEFKAILTASIAISLFYVCLFLYEPIKGIIPLNIFSVWLMLSLIGAAAVNWKEVIEGLKSPY